MPTDATMPTNPAVNTHRGYGAVTKTFHWLTALLILTAIPLGLVANQLPTEPPETLALKAQLFSLHKTVGVAIFFVALARIAWAMTQPKPAPVHPERRAESWAAETAHWVLYTALVVVPLSGWIHHASSQGFAPILWPFGQTIPLVPQSDALFEITKSVHLVFTKVLAAAVFLHIAGALKHVFIDRDITLPRMWFGSTDVSPVDPGALHPAVPAVALTALIYAGGFAIAWAVTPPLPAAQAAAPALDAAEGGNWQVQDGTLGLTVVNFGSEVQGSFSDWTARIAFSEEPADGTHGEVEVRIAIPSLSLGSVTDEALGAQYFNASEHPEAIFAGPIVAAENGYIVEGTLDLAGQSAPVELPFSLQIDGDTATMNGQTRLDRRTFGIGSGTTDPDQLGFGVDVDVELTATQTED